MLKTLCSALFFVLVLGLPGFGNAAESAGDTPDLADLARDLSGDDGNARRKAAATLGSFRSPEAVRLLAEAYRSEQRDAFGVKAACAEALGETGLAAAAAPLAAMSSDPDYWVRKKAAAALGKIPDQAGLAPLEQAAADPDPRVRARALLSLGEVGGGLETVRAAVRDPDDRVAAAALEALDDSGAPGIVDTLGSALSSPRWMLRHRAARLLARRGDPRGFQVLEEEIRAGRHAGTALRETVCLGESAVPLLVGLFEDTAAGQKKRILEALGDLDCAASTRFFSELAANDRAPVGDRVHALMVLFARRESLDRSQVESVADLLGEQHTDLVAVALQVLLDAGNSGYLGRVAPLARHQNKVVRHFALANLARFGGPEYESDFVTALSAREGTDVRLALEALGRVGTSAALPAIQPLTQNRKYRRFAIAAIEAIEARR